VRWVAPAFSDPSLCSAPSLSLPSPSLRFPLARRLVSSAGLLSRIRGAVDEDELVVGCCWVDTMPSVVLIIAGCSSAAAVTVGVRLVANTSNRDS
jgi:hypothetical protein